MNQSDNIKSLNIISCDIGIFNKRLKRYELYIIACNSLGYTNLVDSEKGFKRRVNRLKLILSELVDQFNTTLMNIQLIKDEYNGSYNFFELEQVVCKWWGVPRELVRSKSRKRELVIPRQLLMACEKVFTTKSLSAIGEYFSNKDHATVLHAKKCVRNCLTSKDETSMRVIEFCRTQVITYKNERKTIYDHLISRL